MTPNDAAEFYRQKLLRVLLPLFVLAGIEPGGACASRLPRPVRLALARVIVPGESALRRLLFFIAEKWVGPIALPKKSAQTERKSRGESCRSAKRARKPVFRLFDSYPFCPELADANKRFGRSRGVEPNIWSFDGPGPIRRSEQPERDPDDALRLSLRLQALYGAAQDFPKQVQRLLRQMELRKQNPPGPGRRGPVRGGFAPGYRKHRAHEVDEILHECQLMAQYRRAPPG